MTNCIDLDAKRLQNSTVLILWRENDDLLGILSTDSTEDNYVFTMNKSNVKRISEANQIVADLTEQHRKAPVIGINEQTNDQKTFELGSL
ncbi:hypothetical protein [Enterococcus gilvus]|uniref:hypothetical protein n=1 Tax=Enterococcus gilvus TaxID=160453 RepID=UPI00345E5D8E